MTPSMDDKHIPSPPVRTTAAYLADCRRGVTRIGYPTYRGGEK